MRVVGDGDGQDGDGQVISQDGEVTSATSFKCTEQPVFTY